ncbi:hypothetical protein CSA08_03140 [Candidatus Gracilibacteria bacterium]|nr:MAG: hypothetical protein CSA08_03140 [Candidatus Gracilibacteria bacterium]
MNLVFTGIQGCGKGTQAKILIEKHGFKLIEMGAQFRKLAKQDSSLGKNIKEIIESGNLVPPEITDKVIKKIIKENKGKKVIYDGFIRNKGNKKSFEEVCENYKVIFFQLSEEKAKERLLGRMYDPESGETFMAGTEVNPKTGTKLVKRKDDNEKSILTRINLFINTTLPVVEIQKKEGKVIEINADQSIQNVAKDIINELKKYDEYLK